jgi:hypothetical protein
MKIDFNDDDFEVIESSPKIQEISSSSDPSFIVHYGWMQKKSERSYLATWSNRYFVLVSDGKLMYFTENVPDIKRAPQGVYKGSIDIGDMHSLIYQRNQAGDGFYFNLECISRSYELFLPQREEMITWMKYLALVRYNSIRVQSDVQQFKSFQFQDVYKFDLKFNPVKPSEIANGNGGQFFPNVPNQARPGQSSQSVPYTATSKEPSQRKLPSAPTQSQAYNKPQPPSPRKDQPPSPRKDQPPSPRKDQPPSPRKDQPLPHKEQLPIPKKNQTNLPLNFQPYVCDEPEKLVWAGFGERNMQLMTFVRWCNYKMQHLGHRIDEISQLGDGDKIVLLVEAMCGQRAEGVVYPAGGMRDKLTNFRVSLKLLSDKKGIALQSHPIQSIISGNMKAIADLCWDIIYLTTIKPINFFGLSDRFGLLRWIQEQLMMYKHLEISNFTESFKDGMAFCALVHSVCGAIEYNDLQQYRVIQNIRLAFDTLYDRYKVPKLLEPDDVMNIHDEICMILYLAMCYNILQES